MKTKVYQNNTFTITRAEGSAPVIEGYAAVYNVDSRVMIEGGKFIRERILPGAFNEAISDPELNCVATVGHDKKQMLARSKSNTLQLSVDDKGLKYAFSIPDTTLGRDTASMVERGDLYESSFIGLVRHSDVSWSRDTDGVAIRTIHKVTRLLDVSLVPDAAYPTTDVIMRELAEFEQLEREQQTEETEKEEPSKEDEPKDEEPAKEEAKEEETPPDEETEKEEPAEKEEAPAEDPESEKEEKQPDPDQGEEIQRDLKPNFLPQKPVTMSYAKIIREQLMGGMSAESLEIQRALQAQAQLSSTGILIARADESTTTTHANLIDKGVAPLDIMGKRPLWQEMGVSYMPNVSGTFTLPYENPIVGQKLAELAAITKDTTTPSGNLVSPNRYGVSKEFTRETLAAASDGTIQAIINDMQVAADRKITAEVYTKALAGATEVAAGAKTKAGLDALAAAVDIDGEGAFAGARSTFYACKGVALDAGSGRFLAEKSGVNGVGETYDGSRFFYSNLFENGVNKEYIVYGDMSKVNVADYGMTEVILDPYTRAGEGIVIVTVNKIANVALRNPNAFAKSPDLDAAV